MLDIGQNPFINRGNENNPFPKIKKYSNREDVLLDLFNGHIIRDLRYTYDWFKMIDGVVYKFNIHGKTTGIPLKENDVINYYSRTVES
jgi:hypothetical protein